MKTYTITNANGDIAVFTSKEILEALIDHRLQIAETTGLYDPGNDDDSEQDNYYITDHGHTDNIEDIIL